MGKTTSDCQTATRTELQGAGTAAALVACLVFLATGAPAIDGDSAACREASSVLEKIAEELPRFQESDRKARFALMKISNAAGVALAYATDEGWSAQETAPLIALRELREPDESGKLLSRNKAPDMIYDAAQSLFGILERICPESQLDDILFTE